MRVAPNLSDALANISDKIVRRFAIDIEDLENLIANQTTSHISGADQQV